MPSKEIIELDRYIVPAEAADGSFNLMLTAWGHFILVDHQRGEIRGVWLEDHLLTIGSKRYKPGLDLMGNLALYEPVGGATASTQDWQATC